MILCTSQARKEKVPNGNEPVKINQSISIIIMFN
jgi:hypothetical protein